VLDLLLALVAFPLILALALALLSAVTLVPFVLALQMAEARGFATARWAVVALAGSLLGLGLAVLIYTSDRVLPVAALLPLIFTWSGPAALWLLTGEEKAIGGRAGAHE